MRLLSIIMIGVVAITLATPPVSAVESTIGKQPVYHKERHTQSSDTIDNIIYDLTIPWPFRGGKVSAMDSDGDGVIDRLDQCPDTPRGARVDARGCPSDSDGDGVYDGIDRCPDTPAGARVDARGCPSDSDGDGVYDGIDRCPNTPKGTKVDKRGCPVDVGDVETQLLDTGMIRTSNILFETNKADLKPESRRILDEIGGTLQQWPELKIEIGGHTDSRGAANYNQTLSERRANAVRDYLVSNFAKVKSGNLSVAGYGESQAIASNDTVAGRAKNRRVEFKVLNEEELKRAIERRKSR